MRSRFFAIYRVVSIGLCAMLAAPASAQVKISCDPPSFTRWTGESALSIEASRQDCQEAERLARRADEMRKDVKKHEKKADAELKQARALRKGVEDRRKEAAARNKEASEVRDLAEKEVDRMLEHSDAVASWSNALSVRIPFRLGDVDTVAVPMIQGIASETARNDAISGFEAYAKEVRALAEGEAVAVDAIATYLEEEATTLEDRAVLHDQRAERYRSIGAAAREAAERLETAARVTQEAALLHQLNASMRFLAETEGQTESKKEIDKAIKFVNGNMSRLPAGVAREASALVSRSREALQQP
jgi:hypothetical protein